VNEVPLSGMIRLNSRYAYAAKNIGRKPAMITTGVLARTLAARMPSVAVKAYAGATEEIPSMVPPNRPTTLLFRPLSAISPPLFRLSCEL
jgi:hypothetical protein